MELVYLWIEEYKNIKNQGFNFSPRFKCEYNKDENELIIEERDYYSIFPENINVTAIVGKNGAGKSSLFKSIMMLIYFNKNKEIFYNLDPQKNFDIALNEIIDKNIIENNFSAFLVIYKSKKFYLLSTIINNFEYMKISSFL